MKRVQLIAQGLILFGLMTQGTAALWAKTANVTLIPDESKVTFIGKGPGGFKFDGTGNGVTGTFKISGPKAIEGQATFPLDNLKTGMDTRDEHMKNNKEEKGLEVKKFPEAKFTPTVLPWEDPSQVLAKETKGPFEGKMTVHGVESPVKGTVSTEVKGDKVLYTFEFPVLLSSHKINSPSFTGLTVQNEVAVKVEASAKVVAQ